MYEAPRVTVVSEVIGVTLFVAVTITLGAIAAQFAFGIADDILGTRTVAVALELQPDGSHLLTYQGGPDHALLRKLTIDDGTTQQVWESPKIGAARPVSAEHGRIIVTGYFYDSADRVVLDTTIP